MLQVPVPLQSVFAPRANKMLLGKVGLCPAGLRFYNLQQSFWRCLGELSPSVKLQCTPCSAVLGLCVCNHFG